MKTIRWSTAIACLSLLVSAAASPAAAPGFIQAAINAAAPGDIVSLPAGTYAETIVLKDGVMLMGAGAGETVLDGGGADIVVRAGKESALLGLTIRNGKTLVHNQGGTLGVFECALSGYTQVGIMVERGAAALLHNVLDGGGGATGIACGEANPYIAHNAIMNHRYGVMVMPHMIPTLEANLFMDNDVAVLLGQKATAVLRGNVYDRNRETVQGGAPGETDQARAIEPGELVPYRGGDPAAYRELLAVVGQKAAELHPVVTYDLDRPIGSFGVTVRNPWPNFSISAATLDTTIVNYDAYDSLNLADLKAEYFLQNGNRPTVATTGNEETEKGLDRYVLDHLYVHPGSYYAEEGRRVFRRLTNLSRIEILLPPGYTTVSVNYPAEIEQDGARQLVRITDVGVTTVHLVMENAAGAP